MRDVNMKGEDMENLADVVIVDDGGRFLRSCYFDKGDSPTVRWASEYPDGALFTSSEAIRIARRLLRKGVSVRVIENYGMASENVALGGD
jgi:hypothetical protein